MRNASSLIFLVLLIGIFYFMLIRPQRRQAEQRRALIESVETGDDVITIGGIHGTVRSIDGEDMELEIAPGMRVTFVKSAVARKVWEEDEEDAALAEAADEEEV
ncbi:MAG TPA: preprotein translocase subunit YajC [Actinomycetota bacterium]|jgi:preprotein translocase subunit YajC